MTPAIDKAGVIFGISGNISTLLWPATAVVVAVTMNSVDVGMDMVLWRMDVEMMAVSWEIEDCLDNGEVLTLSALDENVEESVVLSPVPKIETGLLKEATADVACFWDVPSRGSKGSKGLMAIPCALCEPNEASTIPASTHLDLPMVTIEIAMLLKLVAERFAGYLCDK